MDIGFRDGVQLCYSLNLRLLSSLFLKFYKITVTLILQFTACCNPGIISPSSTCKPRCIMGRGSYKSLFVIWQGHFHTHSSCYVPKNNPFTMWPVGIPPNQSPPHHYPFFLMIILFYVSEFFMLESRGIHLGRAESRAGIGCTVHSHYSYLDAAPVWFRPGPSVGFRSSISAICAFLRRLWGPLSTPKRLAFLWNNQGDGAQIS